MGPRKTAFHALKNDPWYSRLYSKLSIQSIVFACAFIDANDERSHLDFEYAVNRMFMDQEAKPKNYRDLMELLVVSNNKATGAKRA